MAISMDVMNEVCNGITLEKVCGVSPDADGKAAGVTKQVNVRCSFEGVTLREVFMAALKPTVIKWQNGPGRRSFDKLGKQVDVHFSSAGARDPVEASKEKFRGMDIQAKKDYMAQLQEIMDS